jgi:hypothetical protein
VPLSKGVLSVENVRYDFNCSNSCCDRV